MKNILNKIVNNQEQLVNQIVNTNSANKLVRLNNKSKIPKELLEDYTAFKVFAHNYNIAVGSIDEYIGGPINSDISAAMTHHMRIRTNIQNPENADIIIDWGDGTTSTLVDYINMAEASVPDNNFEYNIGHTYEETGIYTVKIYGKNYYGISSISQSTTEIPTPYNLICEIFSNDLPIASNLTNISSMCRYAYRLLHVFAAENIDFNKILNITNLFSDCPNLISAKGFKNKFISVNACNTVFNNCYALSSVEFTIPPIISRGLAARIFRNCSSLIIDINDIIPAGGFSTTNLDINNLFFNCINLSGIIPTNHFWNNHNISWISTASCFNKCSVAIRSQAPTSWGGTAPDSIILKNTYITNSEYTLLENKIDQLSGLLSSII